MYVIFDSTCLLFHVNLLGIHITFYSTSNVSWCLAAGELKYSSNNIQGGVSLFVCSTAPSLDNTHTLAHLLSVNHCSLSALP